HFAFEFRTGLRNKDLLLLNYLFPLGFYAMMGVMMGQINPLFIETMIPAMAVFAILSATVLGLPNPLVEAREGGIFRSFKINGVPSLSILSIPALTTAFHAIIACFIIAATAGPLFHAPMPANWVAFGLLCLLASFTCAGLGALIGVISDNTRVTILWSQLIYLPSIMLSGMMVPTGMLPFALRKAGLLLPSTYAMHAFQGLAQGQATDMNPWAAVGILAAGCILAFGLALYLFRWDSRNTTRRGHPALALLALTPYALGAVLF
ncbi:MAG: ABC transporter permease, partial [Anaerolineae bacterium]